MRGRLIGTVAGMVVLIASTGTAHALPTYTSPDFDGSAKVPDTKPLPPPPQVKLATDGLFPDTVVDDAGTAHIVWSEGRGDAADAVVYCRLPRGAKACNATTTLVPAPHYDQFDGPQFDIDNAGPSIAIAGNQLVILSYRYPTHFATPDGQNTSGGVVEWTSDDGGTSWTGGSGAAAKQDITGGSVAFVKDGLPRVATISQEGFCGTCVGQLRPGGFDGTSANIGTGLGTPDANYDGGLALDGGLPAATYSDLSHNAYVRRWTGTEPLTNPATWGPAIRVAGDEPSIAGGPGGLFLMTRAPSGTPTLSVQRVGATAAAAAARITPPDVATQFGKLAEDTSGNLVAAWQQGRDYDDDKAGLHLAKAAGTAFGAGQLQIPGVNAGQPALASAFDGGGFLVGNGTGGINSPGDIIATGFGTPKPTQKAGLGALPGGGDPNAKQECQKASFGAVRIQGDGTCWLHGTGDLADVDVTEGTIDFNGLKIVPDPGTRIAIDAKHHKFFTEGAVRVIAETPQITITLWHGPLKVEVPDDGPGEPLFSFDTSKFPVDLAGFGITGKIDVILTPDGVRIPISLKLPAYLGNVTGAAELIAKTGSGLQLSSVRLHAGPIPIGILTIDSVDITYTADGDKWTGGAEVHFPPAASGGAIRASVEFDMGDLNGAAFDYTPPTPGIVIGPAVYITKLGGSFKLNPLHIGIDGTIGAGAAVNGVSPISVDGHFDVDVPNDGPFTLTGRGALSIAALHVADATVQYVSSGYVTFAANIDLSLPVISLKGGFTGFADGRNLNYGGTGQVSVCVDIPKVPAPCIDGSLAVSPKGLAACAAVKVPTPHLDDPGHTSELSGGVYVPWDSTTAAALLNPLAAEAAFVQDLRFPCHTNDFVVVKPPGARAAQAGTTTVQLPAGLPTATILVTGSGDAPDVSVSGPGGVGLTGNSAILRTKPDAAATYVVLDKPAAGTWTVTTNPGSAPITGVMQSAGYTAATVKAKLGGGGRDRSLRYDIGHNGNGQTVAFIENGAKGTRTLGTTSKGSGTIHFGTGVDLPAGKRTIVALIAKGGLVTDRVTVGSYTAPAPPTLPASKHVKVARLKGKAIVSFAKVKGADHYEVKVRGTHGLRRLFITKKAKVAVTGLAPGDKISATVRAVTPLGRRGATASS